jgi:hypothetical protein
MLLVLRPRLPELRRLVPELRLVLRPLGLRPVPPRGPRQPVRRPVLLRRPHWSPVKVAIP